MKPDLKTNALSRVQESKIIAGIEAIKHSLKPENSSEVIALLDRIINMRSEKMIQLMYEELSKAGMVREIGEIHRTLVLRLIALLLTEFQKKEGYFPQLRKESQEDEYILAAIIQFQILGNSVLFNNLTEESA